MAQAEPRPDSTTIRVPIDLKESLDDAMAYPSMSYADLLRDMLASYEPPETVADGGRG